MAETQNPEGARVYPVRRGLDMMSVMILTFIAVIVVGVIVATISLFHQGDWARVCEDADQQIRVRDGLCLRDNPHPDRFHWVFYEHADQAGYVGSSTEGALTSHPNGVGLTTPAEYRPGYIK